MWAFAPPVLGSGAAGPGAAQTSNDPPRSGNRRCIDSRLPPRRLPVLVQETLDIERQLAEVPDRKQVHDRWTCRRVERIQEQVIAGDVLANLDRCTTGGRVDGSNEYRSR